MLNYKGTFIDNIYRKKELKKFRNDIDIYFNNIKCSSWSYKQILNDISENKIREINLKLARIKKYIKQTWVSTSIHYKSQVQWVQWNIDIFENISESYTYQFDKQMYFTDIDRALWKYNDDFLYSIIRTFNPLFWLNKIILFIIYIPFYILWYSGIKINNKSYQTSIFTKIYSLALYIITIIAGLATILSYFWINYK
jgi:uncharacterized protein YqfB (UPF0267 family)